MSKTQRHAIYQDSFKSHVSAILGVWSVLQVVYKLAVIAVSSTRVWLFTTWMSLMLLNLYDNKRQQYLRVLSSETCQAKAGTQIHYGIAGVYNRTNLTIPNNIHVVNNHTRVELTAMTASLYTKDTPSMAETCNLKESITGAILLVWERGYCLGTGTWNLECNY